MSERHAGAIVPLSAAPSSDSWGIGELPDVAALARWLSTAGFDRLMILPLSPSADGTASPYAARSLLAIAPWHIALPAVEDFRRAGGTAALSAEGRQRLAEARAARRIDYAAVGAVKREALEAAFDRFDRDEWGPGTLRAEAFAGYVDDQRWWLDDFALFQALRDAHADASWRRWPRPLRDRHAEALEAARARHGRDVRRHQYWQWVAEAQWQAARRAARGVGVQVCGDLPFASDVESADVWTRASEFRLAASIGAPPDAFNRRGQNWGLPAYRWDRVAASGDEAIAIRARRMAALYDGFRIDHVVGWYRMYVRPRTGRASYVPRGRTAQRCQGERLLAVFQATGAGLLAEDLGAVPPFVRESLSALGVPGCKVLRWERDGTAPARPFRDPAGFAACSAAMTGTHDTETLAGWWDQAPVAERAAALALPALRDRGFTPGTKWGDALRDAFLELLWGAGSDDVYVMLQDVFGWRDRINTPGTVGDFNWSWRLPWPVDRWPARPEAAARAKACRHLSAYNDRACPRRPMPT